MESTSLTVRPDVTAASSGPRQTPTPPRTAFKEVLAGSLVRGAEAAVRVLPGAPLMAVALRGAGGTAALGVPVGGASVRSGAGPEGPAPGTGGLGGMQAPSAASVASAALGGGGEAPGIESSLAQSQEMNLYFLQVQEAVNAQNRSYTALSNVLKAQHETVKTAIGNIR